MKIYLSLLLLHSFSPFHRLHCLLLFLLRIFLLVCCGHLLVHCLLSLHVFLHHHPLQQPREVQHLLWILVATITTVVALLAHGFKVDFPPMILLQRLFFLLLLLPLHHHPLRLLEHPFFLILFRLLSSRSLHPMQVRSLQPLHHLLLLVEMVFALLVLLQLRSLSGPPLMLLFIIIRLITGERAEGTDQKKEQLEQKQKERQGEEQAKQITNNTKNANKNNSKSKLVLLPHLLPSLLY